MDGEGEVRDQFTAGYEEEDWNDTMHYSLANTLIFTFMWTYVIKLSNIQHNPNVQPVVTSPRKLCQSSSNPGSRCWPATMVVKTIRISATP